MKKFLALTLVFMLTLCFIPGISAFGSSMNDILVSTDPPPTDPPPTDPPPTAPPVKETPPPVKETPPPAKETPPPVKETPPPAKDKTNAGGSGDAFKRDDAPYVELPWKLVLDYDTEGHKTAAARTYSSPVSDEGVYEYDPGYWLLGQMLSKLDDTDVEYRYLELTAGSFNPVTVPALVPYEGGVAGEPVYSALFRLPSQDEGCTLPDKNIELVLFFPGDIVIRVPAQELSSTITAVDLKVYSDRLVLDFIGGEDAEAYIEIGGSGTPVWIDAEGNEVEAEYEYDEVSGVYKIAVKSGLSLAFKP